MISALRETDTGNDVPVLNPRAWRRGDGGVFSSLSGLPISRVITMSLGELSFVLLHVRPERDRETALACDGALRKRLGKCQNGNDLGRRTE